MIAETPTPTEITPLQRTLAARYGWADCPTCQIPVATYTAGARLVSFCRCGVRTEAAPT